MIGANSDSNPGASGPATAPLHGQAQQPAKRPPDEKIEELWSVTLPAWLDDWSPQVAQGLADGAWTAGWRWVAAYAPPVALVLGLLCRLIFRDLNAVYTESLLFMMLVVVGGILSGPVGLMLLAGYIIEDLILGDRVGPSFGAALSPNPAGVLGGKLISYLLLALPAVVLPVLGRQLAAAFTLHNITDHKARIAARAGIDAVIFGSLIYLWSQSMLVLVRPLFSLVGAEPPAEAMTPLQGQALWLVFAAALAAALRVVLVEVLLPKARRAGVAATLQRQRWTGDKKGLLERVPEPVRVGIAAALVTMVLAGTYEGWLDLFIAAIVIGILAVWQANLVHRIPIPMGWALAVRKISPLLRLLGAVFIGYVLSILVLAPLWGAMGGVRLLMVGSLLSLLVFNLLFPPLPVAQPGKAAIEQQVPGTK